MTRSRVTAVLGRIYPQRSVTAVEPTAAGGRRDTAVVRFGSHPPVVVQFSPDPETVRTEAALVAAIRDRTSVPVPAVLSHGTHEGIVYLVSEHRPGTDLHTTFAASDPGTQRDLAAQFGRYLGELHAAFVFDGCGGLLPERRDDGGGDRLTAPGTECGRWLVDYGRRAVDRLPAEFDTHRTRLCDCVDAAAGETSTPTLFPWDLRPGNALVDGDTVSAVVDWERPTAAPPGLAVAKAEYLVADWYVDDPTPLRRAVRSGYESVRPVPAVGPHHRVAAIAASAVDSRGTVTNPGYPERYRPASVAFHRAALTAALPD
jgi:aminoglycoside phosphotransferase (APT) family kinase protein